MFGCIFRVIAETVLRTTFSSMASCKDQDSAVVHAISSLTNNAMHLSMVPVLQERFIQRAIQYEPLLGLATLGITMKVPVVSMKSIMQLMNGRSVSNKEDLKAMRKFVQDSLDSNSMVQYLGMDGYDAPAGGALPGYVTCRYTHTHTFTKHEITDVSHFPCLGFVQFNCSLTVGFVSHLAQVSARVVFFQPTTGWSSRGRGWRDWWRRRSRSRCLKL